MKIIYCIYLLLLPLFCLGQSKYVINNKRGSDKINFKLINNVIIIPVEVNGVKLSFILDSGVRKPIVFNFLKASDSLKILNSEKIYLKGLGNNGKVEALKSSTNIFKVGDAVNNDQDFYIVFDTSVNFAPKLGVPIHGILGYDLFKDLVVEINYTKQYIRLTTPKKHKYRSCKKCETFGLEFYNNKPYFHATIAIRNMKIPVKLLIDSGSSDALWLLENDSLGLSPKANFFNDFLGYGLSGSVHGKRAKAEALNLKSFTLKNTLVAYPDSTYTSLLKKIKGRSGSVGGEILKRFHVTIDYGKARMVLKPNSNFKNRFSYNKSGLELENEGIRVVTEYQEHPKVGSNFDSSNNTLDVKAVFANTRKYVIRQAYTISSVRANSPAAKVGLQKGDVIIKINGNNTTNYTLQNIISKFYGKEGDSIKLEVERLGRRIEFHFILESLLN